MRPFLKSLPAIQGRIHDRSFMIDYFKRHTEAVLAAVPKDRLLVFEAAQGWPPLCAFLGTGTKHAVPAGKFARRVPGARAGKCGRRPSRSSGHQGDAR